MSNSYREFLGLQELPEGTTYAAPLIEMCSPLFHAAHTTEWSKALMATTVWLAGSVNTEVVIRAGFETATWLIEDRLSALRLDTSAFAGHGWLGWEIMLDGPHWRLFIEAVYAKYVELADPESWNTIVTAAVFYGNAATIAAAYPQDGFAPDQTEAAVRDAIEAAAVHYHKHVGC